MPALRNVPRQRQLSHATTQRSTSPPDPLIPCGGNATKRSRPWRERRRPSLVSLPKRGGGGLRAAPRSGPSCAIPAGFSARMAATRVRRTPERPLACPRGSLEALPTGDFGNYMSCPQKAPGNSGQRRLDCSSTARRHNSANFLKELENRLGHEPFGSLARLRGAVLRQPSILRYICDISARSSTALSSSSL